MLVFGRVFYLISGTSNFLPTSWDIQVWDWHRFAVCFSMVHHLAPESDIHLSPGLSALSIPNFLQTMQTSWAVLPSNEKRVGEFDDDDDDDDDVHSQGKNIHSSLGLDSLSCFKSVWYTVAFSAHVTPKKTKHCTLPAELVENFSLRNSDELWLSV